MDVEKAFPGHGSKSWRKACDLSLWQPMVGIEKGEYYTLNSFWLPPRV